jgi:DNA-binding MarR family transcriptional regulator/GNAT superfamily N-acetyltransferase
MRKTGTTARIRDRQDPPQDLEDAIRAARQFNRFYTKHIGVVNESILKSEFSLADVRVLYEIAHRDGPTATEVAKALDLDPGYLSRMLRNFQRQRLIVREPSAADGRQSLVRLTDHGRRTFAGLDARSHDHVAAMLARLSASERPRLIGAMHTIESLLGEPERSASRPPYILRPHQPGDMGWVVHRHGVLYAQEYGWDETFEALVAVIVGEFIQHFDPKRERCWIAERDGEPVGSVFLVRKSETVAKLRLLLVEPKARGLGIGRRLVAECVRYARQVGYRKMTLWTQSNLSAARHLYEEAGFRLVDRKANHSFGHDLVSETWELTL